jgi:hypothetical protein
MIEPVLVRYEGGLFYRMSWVDLLRSMFGRMRGKLAPVATGVRVSRRIFLFDFIVWRRGYGVRAFMCPLMAKGWLTSSLFLPCVPLLSPDNMIKPDGRWTSETAWNVGYRAEQELANT